MNVSLLRCAFYIRIVFHVVRSGLCSHILSFFMRRNKSDPRSVLWIVLRLSVPVFYKGYLYITELSGSRPFLFWQKCFAAEKGA